jgi:hypothetical protein
LGALVVGTAWTVLSGIGGFGFQTGDFLERDAVLWELITRPWPVLGHGHAEGATNQLALSYSVAWYLPAAVAGKLCGWTAAQWPLLWCWGALLQ